MNIGRRKMLAGAPAAGMAAPIIARQAMDAAAGQMNIASRGGALLGGDAGYVTEAAKLATAAPDPSYGLWQKGYNAFREAMKPHEAADATRNSFRSIAGFDADLYALKSVPLQNKVLIQLARDRERDEQRRSLTERLRASIAEKFGIKDFYP